MKRKERNIPELGPCRLRPKGDIRSNSLLKISAKQMISFNRNSLHKLEALMTPEKSARVANAVAVPTLSEAKEF